MFRYVGYGDHAGSGIPKVLHNWHEQHWQVPFLTENNELGFTKIELRMISLFPEETHERLLSQFGSKYLEMPERDRIILVTTALEGMVTHKRVCNSAVNILKISPRGFAGLCKMGSC